MLSPLLTNNYLHLTKMILSHFQLTILRFIKLLFRIGAVDNKTVGSFLRRKFKHRIVYYGFAYTAQTTGAKLEFHSLFDYEINGTVFELQFDAFHVKQFLV